MTTGLLIGGLTVLTVRPSLLAQDTKSAKTGKPNKSEKTPADETPADTTPSEKTPSEKPSPLEKVPPVAAPAPRDTTLFLMVRAGPGLTEKQIINTLKRGVDKANCRIAGDPMIKALSSSVFLEFDALVNPDTPAPTPAPVSGDIGIRPLPTREPMVEVGLRDPAQILKKLTVSYKKAGTKEYVPAGPGRGPLTLIVPGKYGLRLEPEDEPVSFAAEVAEIGKPVATLKDNKWPAGDRFYIITLRNFAGDRDALMRVVQDPEQVPNPLTNVRLDRDLVFVFASLDTDAGRVGKIFDGNFFVPRVPGAEGRKAKRVWMYFPVSAAEIEKVKEDFRKFDSEVLSQEIRKNSAPFEPVAELSAEMPAKWYELLPEQDNSKTFTRRFPLRDAAAIRAKYPKVHRLLVWEFDDGRTPPEAIGVQHPEAGRVFVMESEIVEWGQGLAELTAEKKPGM